MPHYEEVKDVSRLVNATLWDMHGQWSGELKLFYFFQHFCVEYIKVCRHKKYRICNSDFILTFHTPKILVIIKHVKYTCI